MKLKKSMVSIGLKKHAIFLMLFLSAFLSGIYADYGAVFSQGFLLEHDDFASKTALAPWLSLSLGKRFLCFRRDKRQL